MGKRMTGDATTVHPDRQLLEEVGSILGTAVLSAEYLTSGAANHIFRLTTAGGSLIMKNSKVDKPNLFPCEADALRHIAQTKSVPVPNVLLSSARYLILEDLGAEKTEIEDDNWRDLGTHIGQMHCVNNDRFGYYHNNYLGIWDQYNQFEDDWVTFFYENRVLCFLDVGSNRTLLTREDRRGIEAIISKIRSLVPPQRPSLCHGDLWKNNVYLSTDNVFYVLDPAIHFGLPEADLAMTQMYTAFPDSFYEGYRESHELDGEWKRRLPLYQLKELILMIAQFEHAESVQRLRSLIREYA